MRLTLRIVYLQPERTFGVITLQPVVHFVDWSLQPDLVWDAKVLEPSGGGKPIMQFQSLPPAMRLIAG